MWRVGGGLGSGPQPTTPGANILPLSHQPDKKQQQIYNYAMLIIQSHNYETWNLILCNWLVFQCNYDYWYSFHWHKYMHNDMDHVWYVWYVEGLLSKWFRLTYSRMSIQYGSNVGLTSRVFPPEAGVFIWYLNKVYSILNDLKNNKDLNHWFVIN